MDFLGKYTEYYLLAVFGLTLIGYIFQVLGFIIPGRDIFEKIAPKIFKVRDFIKNFFKKFGGKKC